MGFLEVEAPLPKWPVPQISNFSDWRPGDLVLVEGGRDFAGIFILMGQKASFKRDSRLGAHLTHVGLYVGGGEIVEAVPGAGVVLSSIWKYCEYRTLFVRRLPYPFTPHDGRDAAIVAIKAIGQPYSMTEVFRSKLIPRTAPNPNAVYCSTFAAFAVNAATGYSLYDDPRFLPLLPSRLATHPDLINVDVEWRQQ